MGDFVGLGSSFFSLEILADLLNPFAYEVFSLNITDMDTL